MGNLICLCFEQDEEECRAEEMPMSVLGLTDESTVIGYINKEIEHFEEKALRCLITGDDAMFSLQESRVYHLKELRKEVLLRIEEADVEALAEIAHKLGDNVAANLLAHIERYA